MSGYVNTPAPHIHASVSVPRIYWALVAALFPVILLGFFLHGFAALRVVVLSLVCGIAVEILTQFALSKKGSLQDGHTVFLLLLFALIIPIQTPVWAIAVGAVAVIIFGKQMYGGLGTSYLHPVSLGVVFLFAFFPHLWDPQQLLMEPQQPLFPLSWLLEFLRQTLPEKTVSFLAYGGQFLGESSGLLILVAASFLLAGNVLRWLASLVYLSLVTVFCLAMNWDLTSSAFSAQVLLGAFLIVGDSVCIPTTAPGRFIFAALTAVLNCLLWRQTSYFVALCFSAAFASALTPWLEEWIKPKGVAKVT